MSRVDQSLQNNEHAAWMMLLSELRRAGVGDVNAGGKDERLHDVIVLWGEELAALRSAQASPYAAVALDQRRDKWSRDWEDKP